MGLKHIETMNFESVRVIEKDHPSTTFQGFLEVGLKKTRAIVHSECATMFVT